MKIRRANMNKREKREKERETEENVQRKWKRYEGRGEQEEISKIKMK